MSQNEVLRCFHHTLFCSIIFSCSLRLKERIHLASIERVSFIELSATINLFCKFAGLWVPSKEDAKTNPEDGFVKRDEQDEVKNRFKPVFIVLNQMTKIAKWSVR